MESLKQASGKKEKEQLLSWRRKEAAPSYISFQKLEKTE